MSRQKIVLYNWKLMCIRHTAATLYFDAINAEIVLLLLRLEIGSNKDV